jgi:hypothetical protein
LFNTISNSIKNVNIYLTKIINRKFITYEDTDYQFSIKYPEKWVCQRYKKNSKCTKILNQRPPLKEIVQFSPNNELEISNYEMSLRILVIENLSTSINFSKITDWIINHLYRDIQLKKVEESIHLDTKREHHLIYTGTKDYKRQKYKVLLKQIDNKIYIIIFICEENKFEDYEEIVEQMIKSFSKI